MFGTEKNPFTQKSLTKKDVDHFLNEAQMKQRYRMHNTYVKSVVPADQLLVFDPKDGWEPLCKFLGVPIPGMSFDRKNKGWVVELIRHKISLDENRTKKL